MPDAERVLREYVADGYTVVWTHGSQFYDATVAVAAENPDVVFIAEQDTEPEDVPENVWVLDRNFHLAFYPLGVLAASASQSGQIAYLGGVTLPFSYSEVHAVEQALEDTGSDATLTSVWTGDFNDPTRAQQFTSQLLGAGNDVILTSLNLGVVGAFEAISDGPAGALMTAKYTDKSNLSPEHYLTSVLYDFEVMLDEILTSIEAGETGGYLGMDYEQGISLQTPQNVDQAVIDEVNQVVEQLAAGEIEVDRDVTPVE
ncbi:BMP family ABC transporter substrate-binding protein [Blastococcus brunescens]|uniref:BMP family ABC transporter substrate-binding protein n=1 Tax=Blastococcus brunescens TaxID=1564165 RepID=A0ABZ1AUW3_9ACTN|nr:BMP family ABC transporter substrate-binding protein [Blastococcus sp. BMG 8361]WRL62366.1 BMP family ABC transporter substrate-binding protein [Blastococcus sp. BMG 8361]